MSIPKTIHMCWFSGDEYTDEIKECIQSWKDILPDYSIKIWNKEMALATNIPFVAEAISKRKWAFAADVLRIYALFTEGGVYMDSDIYLLKRFDKYMSNSLTFFQEYNAACTKEGTIDSEGNNKNPGHAVPGIGIQAAFIIGEKGHPFLEQILNYYKKKHFIFSDGSLFMNPIAPGIFAMEAEKIGYKYLNIHQVLQQNVIIEPSNLVGTGIPLYNAETNFAVHCVAHSWNPFQQPPTSLYIKIKSKIKKILQFLCLYKRDEPIATEYYSIKKKLRLE